MSEQQEPVEILGVEEEGFESVGSGTDPDRLHAWLRTVAVIGGMLSLLWIGASAASARRP